ncbi:MAG: TonB-dependent receptor [Burkholderiaceae bacterium]|nr:TonB-dependent receptor [Burkholderiaceae bacterium]
MSISLPALCARSAAAPCLAALALCAPHLAVRADDGGTVVVTASRSPQLLTDALPHTTVLLREDIERSQALDLPALLAAEAGVQFASNGARGTATALFLRGAPTRQVLVLVDGVPLARQDATGQVGIEHLMLDQVERVEVVRGNVSALYGSGAVGGVVQVFTRRGNGGPQASVRIEGGSRGLLQLSAQGSATLGATQLALGVSGVRDDGYSALDPAQVPAANPDRDGYRNTSASFNLSHALAEGHKLGFGWTYSDGRLDYDSAFATPADLQTSRTTKNLFNLSLDDRFSADWTSRLLLSSQRDDARYDETGAFGFSGRYVTEVSGLNWTHGVVLSPAWTLSAGLDHQRQSIAADDGFGGVYDRGRNVDAVFGGLQWRSGAHDLALNLRHDDVGGVGSETTGSLGWGWQLAPDWKLIARVGNAFSAPPLGYLYAPFYGNDKLQPELARSGELGLQWAVTGQRLRATWFDTRVREQIEYDTVTNAFANLASTCNRGLELSYGGRFGATDVSASLTLQDPVDESTGQQLLRRSERLAAGAVSHGLGAGWRLGLALRYVGSRPDAGSITLAAYTVADLTAQWQFSKAGQLFGRIENLGDVTYQTAVGYNQPPRGAFVALRWQL